MRSDFQLEGDSIVVQAKDQLSSPIDDELMMMSVKNGKYYGLDAVSRRIWELMAEPVSISRLCDQLLKEYGDVDDATCRKDTLEFVSQLVDAELVEIVTC